MTDKSSIIHRPPASFIQRGNSMDSLPRRFVAAALFSVAVLLSAASPSTAQGLGDVILCRIDSLHICQGETCEPGSFGNRIMRFDVPAGETCVYRPDNPSECEFFWRFEVARRTEKFMLLSYRREGQMFLIGADGSIQGADLSPGKVFAFQGRCRAQGG
jgi:hypothetical protein